MMMNLNINFNVWQDDAIRVEELKLSALVRPLFHYSSAELTHAKYMSI